MTNEVEKMAIDIIQDMDLAISVMRSTGKWLKESGKNPSKMKLRKIYEKLGFDLVAVEQEDYRQTAFYQKWIS